MHFIICIKQLCSFCVATHYLWLISHVSTLIIRSRRNAASFENTSNEKWNKITRFTITQTVSFNSNVIQKTCNYACKHISCKSLLGHHHCVLWYLTNRWRSAITFILSNCLQCWVVVSTAFLNQGNTHLKQWQSDLCSLHPYAGNSIILSISSSPGSLITHACLPHSH